MVDEATIPTMLALLPGSASARARAGLPQKRKRREIDDLYCMRYRGNTTTVKIGRSDNPQKRARGLEAGQDFFVDVVAIFPKKGYMESHVHEVLKEKRSTRGAGTEWFDIPAEEAVERIAKILADEGK